jgi:hypothetical protein
MDILATIADRKITEAMARGDLDNLARNGLLHNFILTRRRNGATRTNKPRQIMVIELAFGVA